MPTPCKHHSDRHAYAHGLCQSCYMKARRAKNVNYVGRAPIGSTVRRIIDIGGFEDAFLARIDISGGADACHPWTHTLNNAGYGLFAKYGHSALAHRLRLAMADQSSISAPVIMHACDNPRCCNPRHLIAGTHSDSTQDMLAKPRNGVIPATHLRDRQTHPRCKPVSTPIGNFASAALAAEAMGIHVRAMSRHCQQRLNGCAYL